jgi:hypothetical protein
MRTLFQALHLPCGINTISRGRQRAEKRILGRGEPPPNLSLASLGPGVDISISKNLPL